MSTFDDLDGVRVQLSLWGYAITGDMANQEAMLAETRTGQDWLNPPWDRTSRDVALSQIRVGGRLRAVPLWFCLRWLPHPWIEQALAAMHEGEGRL